MGSRESGKVATVFRQSLRDFPCKVELGKLSPSFGIERYRNGLRFIPTDDEGFTLRGDKQRLVYKGRRRSHRFTILGDGAFEYDCILNREPESNVISLIMNGAESFDFLRQPDFVPDPFLKGSYAVYKKETLLGEGTGKLCHIHRPEVIDARGRRCWGDLAVIGNELRITIPGKWLGEAVYPVVVDPTIGTTTVGSQITGPNPNYYTDTGYDRPMLDSEYALNKYLVPENGNGVCTAFVYCYYSLDYFEDAIPYLYNNVNDKPFKKMSKKEKYIDTYIPKGASDTWRSNTFELNENIIKGDYVWFGMYSSYFSTRFDYGGECYKGYFEYDDEDELITAYITITPWDIYCNLKWSWYFNYTAVTSQNYIRTLTQGVTLSDINKPTVDYKRNAIETVQANSFVVKLQSICRKLQEAVHGLDGNSFSFLFFRMVKENAAVTETINKMRGFFRGLADGVKIGSEIKPGRIFSIRLADTVQTVGTLFRGLVLYVKILTQVFVKDYLLRRFLIAKEEIVLKSRMSKEIILDSRID